MAMILPRVPKIKPNARDITEEYLERRCNLDNEIDETFDRLKLKTGGLVPNVKEDPADRIDPFTGEPYQAKDTLDEQMEKLF